MALHFALWTNIWEIMIIDKYYPDTFELYVCIITILLHYYIIITLILLAYACSWFSLMVFLFKFNLKIYIYIYIYICVCVCIKQIFKRFLLQNSKIVSFGCQGNRGKGPSIFQWKKKKVIQKISGYCKHKYLKSNFWNFSFLAPKIGRRGKYYSFFHA